MSSYAVKRIMKERLHYNKNPLDKEGIFMYFNDDDLFNVKMLIIGPENTPYENGFYLFNFKIPQDYPHKPPKGMFMTIDGKTRMNPNLYENGYICLSLLGTWAGPSWTSSNTLLSIGMSIRALVLNENPIQNEPSFEKETGEKSKSYIRQLIHENLRLSVCTMLTKTPSGFECCLPKMREHFKQNYSWYINKANQYIKNDGKSEKAPIWKMVITYKYKHLIKHMQMIGKALGIENLLINKEPIKKIYKRVRKAPKVSSNNYDVGFEMVSENDGKLYVVVENKNGVKRWKKI